MFFWLGTDFKGRDILSRAIWGCQRVIVWGVTATLVAYVIGTYQLMFGSEDERVQDTGKYVDVWEKVDGDWKVMVEMYSSNLPPE